jgi:hypothetical protein
VAIAVPAGIKISSYQTNTGIDYQIFNIPVGTIVNVLKKNSYQLGTNVETSFKKFIQAWFWYWNFKRKTFIPAGLGIRVQKADFWLISGKYTVYTKSSSRQYTRVPSWYPSNTGLECQTGLDWTGLVACPTTNSLE